MASDRMRAETAKFRLGYVAEPLAGHEQYKGMLAIPYLRRSEERDPYGSRIWSTVSIRFRCIQDDCVNHEPEQHLGHGKYLTQEGDRPRLFNTVALLRPNNSVIVCEGEFDAITASVYGFEAVGVPGVQSWSKHFTEPFLGYETVHIIGDGDEAGREFAKKLRGILPNGKIVRTPWGKDINKWITNPEGYNEFRELVT